VILGRNRGISLISSYSFFFMGRLMRAQGTMCLRGPYPQAGALLTGDICLALLAQWTRPDLAPGVFCRQDRSPHTILLLLHPFNGLFSRTTWVCWYHQKGKTSLDLNEARDDGVLGRQWHQLQICKLSAPRSRQITTPTPRHSVFTGRML